MLGEIEQPERTATSKRLSVHRDSIVYLPVYAPLDMLGVRVPLGLATCCGTAAD